MTTGVFYFTTGDQYLLRLLVAIHSLRKHYAGPIQILTCPKDNHLILEEIAATHRAVLSSLAIDLDYRDAILEKARFHQHTLFDTTLVLDADTTIEQDITELWPTDGELVVTRQGTDSINAGVLAFPKDHPITEVWYETARSLQGRTRDEEALKLLLPRLKHRVVSERFNRHPRQRNQQDTVIWHYYGKRHVWVGGINYWTVHLRELWEKNTADVRSWAAETDDWFDRHLYRPNNRWRRYMGDLER